jgi:hypothetical protein
MISSAMLDHKIRIGSSMWKSAFHSEYKSRTDGGSRFACNENPAHSAWKVLSDII